LLSALPLKHTPGSGHVQSYNELFEERNTLEEKCSLLEEKMLKLIETVKTQRSKNMTGSQVSKLLFILLLLYVLMPPLLDRERSRYSKHKQQQRR